MAIARLDEQLRGLHPLASNIAEQHTRAWKLFRKYLRMRGEPLLTNAECVHVARAIWHQCHKNRYDKWQRKRARTAANARAARASKKNASGRWLLPVSLHKRIATHSLARAVATGSLYPGARATSSAYDLRRAIDARHAISAKMPHARARLNRAVQRLERVKRTSLPHTKRYQQVADALKLQLIGTKTLDAGSEGTRARAIHYQGATRD